VNLGEFTETLPHYMILVGLWFVVIDRRVNGKHLQGLTSAHIIFLCGIFYQFSLLGRP
jgi:hypothetical protein